VKRTAEALAQKRLISVARFTGSLAFNGIVNPALKGWAIFIRPLTPTDARSPLDQRSIRRLDSPFQIAILFREFQFEIRIG